MQGGMNAVRTAMDRDQALTTVSSLLGNVDVLELLVPRVVDHLVQSPALMSALEERLLEQAHAAKSASKPNRHGHVDADGKLPARKRASGQH